MMASRLSGLKEFDWRCRRATDIRDGGGSGTRVVMIR